MSAAKLNIVLSLSGLVSLWELMEIHQISELVDLQSFVANFSQACDRSARSGGSGFRLEADQLQHVSEKIIQYVALLNDLGLHVSGRFGSSLLQSLERAEKEDDIFLLRGQNLHNMIGALTQLTNVVGTEMQVKLFLVVPPDKRRFFEQIDPIFGKTVLDAFPDASEDISEAGICYAVGRYTATVFHLMRAMEIAIHALGSKIGATVTSKIGGFLPWGVLIANIHGKIKLMSSGDDKKSWSEVHALLYHVNQAWRTETMHPKRTYTEGQAREILDAVKAFMNRLAPLVATVV